MNAEAAIFGAGLGLRRTLLDPLSSWTGAQPDFLEVAPENWLRVGGRLGRNFRRFTERHAFVCHGLSLSLGATDPLDFDLLRDIKAFLLCHQIRCYSEHLSYCSDQGHLYDLLPMAFTGDAVLHVADRIRQVQDFLERRIAIENVSYYATLPGELSELDFLNAVLVEADCDLLLDVNNVYVNSINHGYDPEAFLAGLPGARIAYGHVAGHFVEAEDLLVDTHGAAVVDPVWRLLDQAYRRFGVFPTLLERDFNIPPLGGLMAEVAQVARMQAVAAQAEPA
ncbi:MAG TPA: DUF692 domain-containing protein [Porticoccaceae bacterium]|nr:DUF692 domain-containing protein [Porticoccaceae bacterium]